MFLHGGWAHILGNMVYLFVFGNHVERSMGHARYLAFYLLCGLGADALEIATAVGSNVPGLGASGIQVGGLVKISWLVLKAASSIQYIGSPTSTTATAIVAHAGMLSHPLQLVEGELLERNTVAQVVPRVGIFQVARRIHTVEATPRRIILNPLA